jgi:methyl-accepting chemotaxis protein
MSDHNAEQLMFQLGQATLEIADKMDSVADKMDSMATAMDQLTGKLDRLTELVTEGFQEIRTDIRHQSETARIQADSISRLITLIERERTSGSAE